MWEERGGGGEREELDYFESAHLIFLAATFYDVSAMELSIKKFNVIGFSYNR